jgi:hypothetical protein
MPGDGWAGAHMGGIAAMQVDREALRNAAKAAPEVQDAITTGVRGIDRETANAAAGLADGWQTAAALRRLATGWPERLGRFADQLGDYGAKLAESADHYQWSEDESTRRVTSVRPH